MGPPSLSLPTTKWKIRSALLGTTNCVSFDKELALPFVPRSSTVPFVWQGIFNNNYYTVIHSHYVWSCYIVLHYFTPISMCNNFINRSPSTCATRISLKRVNKSCAYSMHYLVSLAQSIGGGRGGIRWPSYLRAPRPRRFIEKTSDEWTNKPDVEGAAQVKVIEHWMRLSSAGFVWQ